MGIILVHVEKQFGGNLFSNQSIYPRFHHQTSHPDSRPQIYCGTHPPNSQGCHLAKSNSPGTFRHRISKCILFTWFSPVFESCLHCFEIFNMCFFIYFPKRMFKRNFVSDVFRGASSKRIVSHDLTGCRKS